MRIELCEKGCQHCTQDSERYDELIGILSQMHVEKGINSPEALCLANSREFKLEHPLYLKHSQFQSELLEIATRHDLPWVATVRILCGKGAQKK